MAWLTSRLTSSLPDSQVARKKGLLTVKNGNLSTVGRYSSQKDLLSDYTIEMDKNGQVVLGTGLSGAVRLARSKDGSKYAVKSFNKRELSSSLKYELKTEAEIYLSLDHPHIARLEQVYETDDEIHMVMELMEGGELFDRLTKKKRYTEEAAAETARQMLLAVAYLHSRQIIHRDLKLENFLYECADSSHLKLIDFGFSKKLRKGQKSMSHACGTAQYVAPEVLARSYTEKADLWSLGVISHMLLTGSPLFAGNEESVLQNVRAGRKRFSQRFKRLSPVAQDFVESLLKLDPAKRLSAQGALSHAFVANRSASEAAIGDKTLHNLRQFAHMSRFSRCCCCMLAWSLPQQDIQRLRGTFLELDVQKAGTISLASFKSVLQENGGMDSQEAEQLFSTLDINHDNEICYSEFLAASMQDRLHVDDEALRRTFHRFDRDDSGAITADNLRTLLGNTFENVGVEELIIEADKNGDGEICYDEFRQCLQEAAEEIMGDEAMKESSAEARITKPHCEEASFPRPKIGLSGLPPRISIMKSAADAMAAV